MSVRRAVDAGRSAWVGLLFFVPLVNYVLMIVLCFLPSRPHAPITPTDEPASSGSAAPAIDQRIRSAMLGLGVSLVPRPYQLLPSMHLLPRGLPWLPVSFLLYGYPYAQDIVGY